MQNPNFNTLTYLLLLIRPVWVLPGRKTVTGVLVTLLNWAASRQNQQNECAPSEDSDQSGHPLYSCGQWRLWSDWADAQAELSLRWAHMLFCWFCHAADQLLSFKKLKAIDDWSIYIISHVITKPVFRDVRPDEPHHAKTSFRGLRPGKTQTGLLSYRS